MVLLFYLSIILLFLATIITITFYITAKRKNAKTAALAEKLEYASTSGKRGIIDTVSLSNLPEPVKRYFHYVLDDSTRFIRLARYQQRGRIKIDPGSTKWSHFEASQIVSENPVGFLWDAKIRIFPSVFVRIIDVFEDGVGSGEVSLMSAITLGSDKNHPKLNAGALYRYLAESVWHPTALLPQSGVKWKAVDKYTAIASLSVDDVSVSLEFRFNNLGQITGIYTEERFGKFGDRYIRYPWEGYFSNYQDFDGVKIPTKGEVGWHLPEGWWLFWKGTIIQAEFDYE